MQFARRVRDEIWLPGNETIGNIVHAIEPKPLGGFRIGHTYLTPKGEAFGIFNVLLEHGVGRPIRLIVHTTDDLIQNGQTMGLINQTVLVCKGNIFFTLKYGIGRCGFDYLCAVDQLFVTASARGIVAGKGGFLQGI